MSDSILTKQDLKDFIESAIVDDLHCADLTYLGIGVRNHVGTNKVATIAKKHNLTRKRGRVLGRKLYRPIVTK